MSTIALLAALNGVALPLSLSDMLPPGDGLSSLTSITVALATLATTAGFTRWTLGHNDRVALVVGAPEKVELLLSADDFEAEVLPPDASELRINNAGPGPALNVHVRAVLLLGGKLQRLADSVRPRSIGTQTVAMLAYQGAPMRVMIGRAEPENWADTVKTYTLWNEFSVRHDTLAENGVLTAPIPHEALRALAWYGALAKQFHLKPPVLRLIISYSTRRDRDRMLAFAYRMSGLQPKLGRTGYVWTLWLEKLSPRAARKLARQDALKNDRNRKLRWAARWNLFVSKSAL